MAGWAGVSRSVMDETECPIVKALCGAGGEGKHGCAERFSWGRSVPWPRSQQRAGQTWKRGAATPARDSLLGAGKTESKTSSAEP